MILCLQKYVSALVVPLQSVNDPLLTKVCFFTLCTLSQCVNVPLLTYVCFFTLCTLSQYVNVPLRAKVSVFTLCTFSQCVKVPLLTDVCFITLCTCGNVRYYTNWYCLVVQAGFNSDVVVCLTAALEILVRSSAGTKGV